jgi:hypothetical protein
VITDEDNPSKAIEKQTALAKLKGEIDAKEISRQVQLAQLSNEERTAQKTLADQTVKAEEALLSIQGKRIEQQRLALELHLQELEKTLRADDRISPADRAAALGTARAQGTAEIDFKAKTDEYKQALKDLQQGIAQIKAEQADGKMFPVQAEQQIVALEQARLPQLQALAAEMERLAKATKDQGNIEAAHGATRQTDDLAKSLDQAGQELGKLMTLSNATFVNGMTNAITGVINGTKTAGQAFRQFGLEMAQALEQAIVKLLVLKALQMATGLSGGGPVGAAPAGHASGGFVSGPGTATSDSIPAMLSDGEFVVHAKAVQQPGVRGLLEAINGGALRGKSGPAGVPHYAAGGMVAGAAAGANFKIVNLLDPTVLGDHLATAHGERAVLNILSNNPNRIRESLG